MNWIGNKFGHKTKVKSEFTIVVITNSEFSFIKRTQCNQSKCKSFFAITWSKYQAIDLFLSFEFVLFEHLSRFVCIIESLCLKTRSTEIAFWSHFKSKRKNDSKLWQVFCKQVISHTCWLWQKLCVYYDFNLDLDFNAIKTPPKREKNVSDLVNRSRKHLSNVL